MGRLGNAAALTRAERSAGKDFSEALARGLAVMRVFDAPPIALTLSEIARRLDLPRATARRALITLVHLGYAETMEAGYRLTPKVVHLARPFLVDTPSVLVCQSHCDQLSRALQATAFVARLDGDGAICMVASTVDGEDTAPIAAGARLSAYETASGQVLLAMLGVQARSSYLHQFSPAAAPSSTMASESALRQRLTAVAGAGYGLVEERAGLWSMSVPIVANPNTLHDHLQPVTYALAIRFAFAGLPDEHRLESMLTQLRDTAALISRHLV